jgi:hypothetical protein
LKDYLGLVAYFSSLDLLPPRKPYLQNKTSFLTYLCYF